LQCVAPCGAGQRNRHIIPIRDGASGHEKIVPAVLPARATFHPDNMMRNWLGGVEPIGFRCAAVVFLRM
jgi:hypothetical protein